MRKPERIDKILNKIMLIWKENPDMRFGQLLINLGVVKDDARTWITEDDELIKFLDKPAWKR